MKTNKLPSKTLFLWQIRVAVINIFIFCLCMYFARGIDIVFTLYGAFTFICLAVIFFYLPKYIKSYTIRLSGDTVIIDSGVFIKTTHIMPYSRMIYTQTFVSPLARKLGIEAVSLKAARSRIIIPEMDKRDAKELISSIAQGERQ